MVIDGLSRCFAALYSATGTTVSYTGGKEIGAAVEMTFEPEEAKETELYANNTVKESDSQVSKANVSITNDGISLADLAFLLGKTLESVTLTGATTDAADIKKLIIDGANPPYIGYGTVVRLQDGDDEKYQAVVVKRMKFKTPKYGGKTQGENKEYQTKELSGTAYKDNSTDDGFCEISSELDTEADAVLFIKDALNIS